MIIDNFYVIWTVLPPFEADTPLLVNTDALLAGPVSPQRFNPATGKIHKIFDTGSAVEDL
jgi:hypothetical protein